MESLERKLQKKEYYHNNKEKIKQQRKQHYNDNKEKIKARTKQYYNDNKEKYSEYYKQVYIKQKDKITNFRLKRNFGITLEQYNEMLEKQNGVCAICHKPETDIDKKNNIVRKLAVDHCHSTGKVRALLCGRCNKAIGLLNDDVDLLHSAINYLNEYNDK